LTHVALVSADAALPLDEDMPPLVEAFRRLGAQVSTPSWDDPRVDWSRFDLALLRSTWDYVERIDEFLAWADACGRSTRLCNPVSVVRWNTDKHYLAELHAAGVAVVPTRFVEPGSDAADALRSFLGGGAGSLSAGTPCAFDQFVVKPSVGAGSRDAARYRRAEDGDRALAHLRRLGETEGRSAMLQPYLSSVDTAGETALMYLGGEPSHAIRKGPLLRLDDGLVAGLFAPEDIRPRAPTPEERALAAATLTALPFERPLYARVDMVLDAAGAPVLLELELTEPSLFLAHAPGSAERLARAALSQID
jgi:glutathione synthase/RimK-type ligase-like ATP-grasp enzyme